jgi:hypothetical protein
MQGPLWYAHVEGCPLTEILSRSTAGRQIHAGIHGSSKAPLPPGYLQKELAEEVTITAAECLGVDAAIAIDVLNGEANSIADSYRAGFSIYPVHGRRTCLQNLRLIIWHSEPSHRCRKDGSLRL